MTSTEVQVDRAARPDFVKSLTEQAIQGCGRERPEPLWSTPPDIDVTATIVEAPHAGEIPDYDACAEGRLHSSAPYCKRLTKLG